MKARNPNIAELGSFGTLTLCMLVLAGCLAVFVLFTQISHRPAGLETPTEGPRPQVTILNISPERTFYDRDIVVVEYLHGVEPRMVTLADYDQVERFLAILERQATVDWLGAAE